MSAERDVNRIVRSWLRTDEHDSADAIVGIVLSRLDTTPQRRSWWPARRFAQMNRLILIAGAAVSVLLVAIVGYNLLPRTEVATPPTVAPSPSSSPSPLPSPSATPITDPIVGTWATGETTCAQQLAAIEAAGYTTEQMTSVGVDLTCKNGITVEGADWANGSQITMEFFSDGTLLASDNLYPASTFTYRLVSADSFEASDTVAPQICRTYGYAIAGDKLTIEIVDNGCPATRAGGPDAPLADQIGLTVLFETSSFTRKP